MIDIRDEHMKALAAIPVVARTLLTTNTGAGGADWIRDQPAAGEWAAIEVAAHMADTDQRADHLTHVTAEDVDHLAQIARLVPPS